MVTRCGEQELQAAARSENGKAPVMFVVTPSSSEFCCFSPFSHLSLDQSFLLYKYLQTSSLCFFLLLGSALLLAGLCLTIPFFPSRQRKGGTLALFSPNLRTWRLSLCSPGLHINLFVLILFVCFWPCWVFVAALVLSLVTGSRGHSRVAASRCLTVGASLVEEHSSKARGLQSFQPPGSRTQAP